MRASSSPLLAAALLAAGTADLDAQTRLTYSGTISSTSDGSTDRVGDSVTFVIITSDNPAASVEGTTLPTFYDESFSNDVDLIQGITGTYLTGSWVRPNFDDSSPYTNVILRETAPFELRINIENDYSFDANRMGLFFDGVAVDRIQFRAATSSDFSAITPSFNYSTFFAPYYGTHAVNAVGSFGRIYRDDKNYDIAFTSLTIGPAGAVPEPSTYGLMLGGLALAGAAVARRRKAKA